MRSLTAINPVIKKFRARVRAGGVMVTTVVYPENVTFAIILLHAVFGAGNVISISVQI